MKNISVIVPIYNVAEYLDCCLGSLYSQVNPSIEVILVNDGSTDESLSICQKYKKDYGETTIIVNKANGGLSDARNAGTKIATGKYIFYLDGDDWLAYNTLQTLYDFAKNNSCEVVQGNFYYSYNDYLLLDEREIKASDQNFILSRNQAMKELIRNQYVKNFAWGKLYLSEITKKHLFKKNVYYEDAYWQHLIINEVNRYGVVTSPLYFYRQRNSSISGHFSKKNLDLLRGYENRSIFIKDKYPDLAMLMFKAFWNISYSFYVTACKHSDTSVRQMYEDYWKEICEYYKDDFHKAMSKSMTYNIEEHCSYLQFIYSLYQRIYHRLFAPKLTRIELLNNNQ